MVLVFTFSLLATASKSFGSLFNNWPIFFIALGIYVFSMIVLVSDEEWRKTSPKNYIALINCTIAMACIVATFSAAFKELILVTLVMGSAVACGSLALAAFYTSTPE